MVKGVGRALVRAGQARAVGAAAEVVEEPEAAVEPEVAVEPEAAAAAEEAAVAQATAEPGPAVQEAAVVLPPSALRAARRT